MNNQRRKRISRCIESLDRAKKNMEDALKDEKAALNRLPENEEYVESRNAIEDIISGLEEAISSLGEALDTLNEADF